MARQFSIHDGKKWKSRFFTIWGGQALSILGSQLVQFALIWYLTVKTGSATILATATLVAMLPNVLLGPFIGTLVDQWDRRKIMLLADSIVSLATVLLAVLFALDVVTIWHIYIVMFIRSLAGSFHSNAMNASTSLLVPVENLTRVQGINQMLNGGLNIISAPLGALLLELMSMQAILMIDVATALIAIVPLLFIQIPQPSNNPEEPNQANKKETVWQGMIAGLKYVVSWPGLMIIGVMTILINFTIFPAFSLLPLMVKDIFGGNAIHLSWVQSAMGIGVFSGGALLGIWGGFKRKIFTALAGVLGLGIGIVLVAFAPSNALHMVIIGALIAGIMISMIMGPFYAIIQSTVEPEMQARVFALMSSVGTAMVPFGLMIAGPISDRYGIQSWFLLGGILCIVMAGVGLLIPAVLHIEDKVEVTRSPSGPIVMELKKV
ncbi:MAG TPA: MFS transporter [Anaerolineaceae bacterium]|nr:MFS transporter [Anaerolineaceae bacterium]